MLELLLCSLVTILPGLSLSSLCPGQAIRQGNHVLLRVVRAEVGHYACVILTVGLITVVFYNHPSTTSVTLFFRTVPILPETIGRVAEIYVGYQRPGRPGRADLQAGQLEAGGCRGDRSTQDRGGRCGAGGGAKRYRRRPRASFARPRALTSRPWTNWRPNRSCIGAIRATWRCARSRSLRFASRGRLGASRGCHCRQAGRRNAALDSCSRPKRPAPKPRWRRLRWTCKRRSSAPA